MILTYVFIGNVSTTRKPMHIQPHAPWFRLISLAATHSPDHYNIHIKQLGDQIGTNEMVGSLCISAVHERAINFFSHRILS